MQVDLHDQAAIAWETGVPSIPEVHSLKLMLFRCAWFLSMLQIFLHGCLSRI